MSLANLHSLSLAEFNASLKALLVQLERNEPLPYFDYVGLVTVGIGFNISSPGLVRNSVYDAMHLSLSDRAAVDAALTPSAMNRPGFQGGSTL